MKRILETSDFVPKNKIGDVRGRYTLAEIERIYDESKGACVICGCVDLARNNSLDHCHKTGKLRGILCTRCNSGLGMFRDDASLLAKAAAYLSVHAENAHDAMQQSADCLNNEQPNEVKWLY